jgi:hypothetical protein
MEWPGMLLLSAAFGLLVTAHVRLLAHLCFTPPRWRAAAALLVPPLAPFWGWQGRLRLWSVVWFVAGVVYGTSLLASAL